MSLEKLVRGLKIFQEQTFKPNVDHFRKLAAAQQPRIMVIGCCDSRVDPALLTNADPGDLFIFRNVANLVPPCAPDAGQHGTSAALEFAVTGLEVEHIIVLGHSRCGGIGALLKGGPAIDREHAFIHNWMTIAEGARRFTQAVAADKPFEHQQRVCEQEAIKISLGNLMTFPWIQERVLEGRLTIHGWYFDVSDCQMYRFDRDSHGFRPLSTDTPAASA